MLVLVRTGRGHLILAGLAGARRGCWHAFLCSQDPLARFFATGAQNRDLARARCGSLAEQLPVGGFPGFLVGRCYWSVGV